MHGTHIHSDTTSHPRGETTMGGSKRGHVISKALMEYADPPEDGEYICRALGSRGNNKIDVELPDDGHHALVILPAKFHKKIWIRKGSFVIVKAHDDRVEADGTRFFNGEIVRVLLKDDEKYLKGLDSVWPTRFLGSVEEKEDESWEGSDSDGDDLPPHLQRVQNRTVVHYSDSEDDSDD